MDRAVAAVFAQEFAVSALAVTLLQLCESLRCCLQAAQSASGVAECVWIQQAALQTVELVALPAPTESRVCCPLAVSSLGRVTVTFDRLRTSSWCVSRPVHIAHYKHTHTHKHSHYPRLA